MDNEFVIQTTFGFSVKPRPLAEIDNEVVRAHWKQVYRRELKSVKYHLSTLCAFVIGAVPLSAIEADLMKYVDVDMIGMEVMKDEIRKSPNRYWSTVNTIKRSYQLVLGEEFEGDDTNRRVTSVSGCSFTTGYPTVIESFPVVHPSPLSISFRDGGGKMTIVLKSSISYLAGLAVARPPYITVGMADGYGNSIYLSKSGFSLHAFLHSAASIGMYLEESSMHNLYEFVYTRMRAAKIGYLTLSGYPSATALLFPTPRGVQTMAFKRPGDGKLIAYDRSYVTVAWLAKETRKMIQLRVVGEDISGMRRLMGQYISNIDVRTAVPPEDMRVYKHHLAMDKYCKE